VRRFVLPIGIGGAGVVEDVTAAELETAVGYMLARGVEAGSGPRKASVVSQKSTT
jgi:3-dehydroquinate synthase